MILLVILMWASRGRRPQGFAEVWANVSFPVRRKRGVHGPAHNTTLIFPPGLRLFGARPHRRTVEGRSLSSSCLVGAFLLPCCRARSARKGGLSQCRGRFSSQLACDGRHGLRSARRLDRRMHAIWPTLQSHKCNTPNCNRTNVIRRTASQVHADSIGACMQFGPNYNRTNAICRIAIAQCNSPNCNRMCCS